MNNRSIALVTILVASGPGSAVLRATIAGGKRNSGSGTEYERLLCREPSSRLFRLLLSGLHTMASRGVHRSAAVREDVDRLHQERRPDGIRSYSRYESADGPELRYSWPAIGCRSRLAQRRVWLLTKSSNSRTFGLNAMECGRSCTCTTHPHPRKNNLRPPGKGIS